MRKKLRIWLVAISIGAAFMAAPTLGWAGTYGGIGRLEAVDSNLMTLTIGGVEMRFGSSVRIQDERGRSLELSKLEDMRYPLVHYYGTRVSGRVLVERLVLAPNAMLRGDG